MNKEREHREYWNVYNNMYMLFFGFSIQPERMVFNIVNPVTL
jgi:hypothetical protein